MKYQKKRKEGNKYEIILNVENIYIFNFNSNNEINFSSECIKFKVTCGRYFSSVCPIFTREIYVKKHATRGKSLVTHIRTYICHHYKSPIYLEFVSHENLNTAKVRIRKVISHDSDLIDSI